MSFKQRFTTSKIKEKDLNMRKGGKQLLLSPHIPFILEVAYVLAVRINPNHIVYLFSWG